MRWFRDGGRAAMASLGLLILTFVVIVRTLFGDNGYVAYERQRFALEMLTEERDEFLAENTRISESIERLKSDPSYQARTIRDKLGYLRPDEFVIFNRP